MTSLAGAQHNDVLNAVPADKDHKERLVDELKRRGNAAFKAKSMREAEILYTKAIEHQPETATLWANRSAARFAMNHLQDSLYDAQEAVRLDPTWSKAYFRVGKAAVELLNYTQAVEAFHQAVKLDPQNKTIQKELEIAVEKSRDARPSGQQPAKRVEKQRSGPSAEQKSRSNETSQNGPVDGQNAEMRGYRKLADGRTTTFFHREISEEAKELIGDRRPVKIEEPLEVVVDYEGSIWNKGGTFEERDMTAFSSNLLKSLLIGLEFRMEIGLLQVTDVTDINGEAAIAWIRGKKRFIFDLTFKIKWKAIVEGGELSGVIFFTDFSSDEPDQKEFQAEFSWSEVGSASDIVKQHVGLAVRRGLKGAADERLVQFIQEFFKQ